VATARDQPHALAIALDARAVAVVVRNVSAESIILDRIAVAPNILGVAFGNNAHSMAEIIEAGYERKSAAHERFLSFSSRLKRLNFI
jgi:hypothetical protein